MLRTLGQTQSIETSQFGGAFPYWKVIDGQVVISDTAEEIIERLRPDERVVDPVAVLSLLQSNYIVGNRTLIQGLQRLPWRAELTGEGKLNRRPPLPHGFRTEKAEKIAHGLREALEEELLEVIGDRKKVFVLLSGGLDSRIVAGVLKKIEPQLHAKIVCVTWGQSQSRDVVYAGRIAEWYGWEFHNVPYDSNLTWENINRGAVWGGAEVAGLHLHGMDWMRQASSNDLVLAASFGDMIGRAEFSSVHLTNLKLKPLANRLNLLHSSLEKTAIELAEKDRPTAWELESPWAPDWVRHELHMGENYMRRFNCHTMDYIRQFCSLHQAFTSNRALSYMWSFCPGCRNDEPYYELLRGLDKRLFSLPWARTGVALDGTKETNAQITNEFHQWGRWLRNDLRARLEDLVFSPGLAGLGLFDATAVRRAWELFLKEPETELRTGQQIVNLSSIAIAQKRFSLLPCRESTPLTDVAFNIPRQSLKFAKRGMKKLVNNSGER